MYGKSEKTLLKAFQFFLVNTESLLKYPNLKAENTKNKQKHPSHYPIPSITRYPEQTKTLLWQEKYKTESYSSCTMFVQIRCTIHLAITCTRLTFLLSNSFFNWSILQEINPDILLLKDLRDICVFRTVDCSAITCGTCCLISDSVICYSQISPSSIFLPLSFLEEILSQRRLLSEQ